MQFACTSDDIVSLRHTVEAGVACARAVHMGRISPDSVYGDPTR
jgi:hypothetical protein